MCISASGVPPQEGVSATVNTLFEDDCGVDKLDNTADASRSLAVEFTKVCGAVPSQRIYPSNCSPCAYSPLVAPSHCLRVER